MATQIGKERIYTSVDEKDRRDKVQCAICKVIAVPRGITSTRKDDIGAQEKHCPNCGHIHGRKNH